MTNLRPLKSDKDTVSELEASNCACQRALLASKLKTASCRDFSFHQEIPKPARAHPIPIAVSKLLLANSGFGFGFGFMNVIDFLSTKDKLNARSTDPFACDQDSPSSGTETFSSFCKALASPL